MNIAVRRASERDIPIITKNVLAMALESSSEHLDSTTVLDGVSNLFKKPDLGFYIVAEQNNNDSTSLWIKKWGAGQM